MHRRSYGLWFTINGYDAFYEVKLKRPDARRILRELNSVGFSVIKDGSTTMTFRRSQGDIPCSISGSKRGSNRGALELHLSADREQALISWLGGSLAPQIVRWFDREEITRNETIIFFPQTVS